MLGRSQRLAHRYGSSLKIWRKRTCVKPSQPTGMRALRRSTTYAGKFGRVLNPNYEPPRPRSAIQTEQVASIKKRRGRMPTRADLSEIARGIPLVTLLAMAFIAVIVFW